MENLNYWFLYLNSTFLAIESVRAETAVLVSGVGYGSKCEVPKFTNSALSVRFCACFSVVTPCSSSRESGRLHAVHAQTRAMLQPTTADRVSRFLSKD